MWLTEIGGSGVRFSVPRNFRPKRKKEFPVRKKFSTKKVFFSSFVGSFGFGFVGGVGPEFHCGNAFKMA
jgi:hypothetical protein